MAMLVPISLSCIVMEANTLIALCAKEPLRYAQAKTEVDNYAQAGSLFYAPNVIVGESLYALRRKLTDGALTVGEHAQAVESLRVRMTAILPPPSGGASLILRAEQICNGYRASRSADALYIALSEELSLAYTTRLLTFNRDLPKKAAKNAPGVRVHLLT